MIQRAAVATLVVFLALTVFADAIAPARTVNPKIAQAQPPLRASAVAPAMLTVLGELRQETVQELRDRNTDAEPVRIGVVRELESSVAVRATSTMALGRFRWRGAVTVRGAHQIRLQLRNLHIPAGAQLWIYSSSGGPAVPFDTSLAFGDELWTPSVAGDVAIIEIDSPGSASFDVAAVADVRQPLEVAPESTACVKDAVCETSPIVASVGQGIAHMRFVSGANVFICSGGLMNERSGAFTPYFLTANHCISTASEASSLETYWDYRTTSCNGTAPSVTTLPRVNGATLLTTSPASDVTLLRLSAKPPGSRVYLGWDTTAVPVGTLLYRVSHPSGQPQRYSISRSETTSTACLGAPRTNFIYSAPTFGAPLGGSSGSPAYYAEGYVVGQLLGACPEGADECGPVVRTIDGALSSSWTLLRPFLDPPTSGCSTCTPNATTACLLDNRFKVTLEWQDSTPTPPIGGAGRPLVYAENKADSLPGFGTINEIAFFATYPQFPNAVEVIIKMSKGVNINNKYWVAMTGFAAYQYTVTVQDTQTCATWTRTNQNGQVSIIRDYEAFPFP